MCKILCLTWMFLLKAMNTYLMNQDCLVIPLNEIVLLYIFLKKSVAFLQKINWAHLLRKTLSRIVYHLYNKLVLLFSDPPPYFATMHDKRILSKLLSLIRFDQNSMNSICQIWVRLVAFINEMPLRHALFSHYVVWRHNISFYM